MSKRLEELFNTYLELKNIKDEFETDFEGEKPVFNVNVEVEQKTMKPNYEIGELFIVDNFMFLLTSETHTHYVGYKVTEWVDFATDEDFLFKFADSDWMAITTDLFIEKEKVKHFIGILEKKYIDVLYNFVCYQEPLPAEFSGLSIPYNDLNYVQNKFRMEELSEVARYGYSVFLGDEKKIYGIGELRDILVNKLPEVDIPLAAAIENKTAVGENYYLHYDSDNNLLKIILNENLVSSENTLKLIFFDDEFLFFPENSLIEFEVAGDLPDLEYLKENIKILNV